VKTIFAAALIFALGFAGISLWNATNARRTAVSSSQIFIHGTPVCVMERAGRIHATVGMCSTSEEGTRGKDPDGGNLFRSGPPPPGEPDLRLPPGHPPIGLPPAPGQRRVLI
jgi:hypothetical protein